MAKIPNDNSLDRQTNMDFVWLPRWVVYCQAILLGLIATTCFIAGIFVGSFGRTNTPVDSQSEFRVSGTTRFQENSSWHADAGAVVLLLPDTPVNSSRQDPTTITPQRFQPLENPAIDSVRKSGGNIVRANLEGGFELFARPGKYELVIISNAKSDDRRQSLSREQVASLSQYFLPVENLINSQQFFWKKVTLTIKDVDVGQVEFQ